MFCLILQSKASYEANHIAIQSLWDWYFWWKVQPRNLKPSVIWLKGSKVYAGNCRRESRENLKGIMTCNGTEQLGSKHLTMTNNTEAFTKKKEKENYSDMKMHNFTECCRWVSSNYSTWYFEFSNYLIDAKSCVHKCSSFWASSC